jgi:hypothetical protein
VFLLHGSLYTTEPSTCTIISFRARENCEYLSFEFLLSLSLSTVITDSYKDFFLRNVDSVDFAKKVTTNPARKLAHSVIEHSTGKIEPHIKKFLTSSLVGDGSSSNDQVDHHEIILDVYQCAPKVIKVVAPFITGEL